MATDAVSSSPTTPMEGLYARKSSGLVREYGMRDAFSMAFSFTNLGGIPFVFAFTLALFPGADLTWPILIGAALFVLLAFAYAQLVSAMPRSGADYVYFGRIVHPIAGAIVGIAWVILLCFQIAQIALAVAQTYLPSTLSGLGSALGIHALVTASGEVSDKLTITLVCAGLTLVTAAIVIFLGRHLGRILFWAIVMGVVTLAVFIAEAAFHSHGTFVQAYNHATGNPHAYTGVLAAAHKSGISLGIHSAAFFGAIPAISGSYLGFTAANFVGGELKRPSKIYLATALTTLGFAAAIILASWLAIRHLAGLQFLQASNALGLVDPATLGKVTNGVPTLTQYYTQLVSGDPVTKVIMALGLPLSYASLMIVAMLIFSRLTFAVAFDRLLPARFADVNEKLHAPVTSVVLGAAGTMAFVIFAVYDTGFLPLLRNLTLATLAIFTFAGLVAALLPYRRRDLYDAAPKVISGSWLGVPPITWLGLGSFAALGWLLIEFATKTQLSGGYDSTSIATLAIVSLSGIVFFVVARWWLRRRGIDLDLAMHELPPE